MPLDIKSAHCVTLLPLFENCDFGIDMKSRVAIVGPNGVGKSTVHS
ncbi:MAG: ATP-binding cassette domain-containing protein [Burkholderiales bacterium]|nr:ATP-binding cassette domain-containing protein [Burkholderiales bacterium]